MAALRLRSVPMTSRSHSARLRTAALLLTGLGLAGCSQSDQEQLTRAPAGGAQPGHPGGGAADGIESGELTVVDGSLSRATWAMGDELYLLGRQQPEKLAGPVQSPFTGTLSPAAVPSPANDGAIAYSSFLDEQPVLRVHEPTKGTDSVVDVGAYSPAWGRQAGLAYFHGLTPRVEDPATYVGHVVVRASPQSGRVRWSAEPGRYIPSAWAGERLIVHELEQTWPTLVVFDGPERRRVLATRATLVALSPDGGRALIAKEPTPTPAVAVVDVASGRELSSFSFSDQVAPLAGAKINYVADSGGWVGDTVIAAVTNGLAVFNVGGERIELEQLLGVDPNGFPTGLTELKSDDTRRYIFASAELMQQRRAAVTRTSIIECDRVERRCVLGPSAPSYLPPRLIYNPSRP